MNIIITSLQAIKDGDMQKIEDWINEIGRESSDRINEIVDDSEKQIRSGNYHYLMRKGMTALHYAALYSKKEIVEVLLKAGAGNIELCSYMLQYNTSKNNYS